MNNASKITNYSLIALLLLMMAIYLCTVCLVNYSHAFEPDTNKVVAAFNA